MTSKTVRPIMTAEARDVLDKMHETCKCDTRSESIVSYHTSNLKMCEQNSKLQDEIQRMKISDLKKSELSTKALEKQKQKTRDCKFISWLMTAALFALLAVTIFNAS